MGRPPLELDKLEADGRRPWDQQPGESGKLYARFKIHLALGRDRRLVETRDMINSDPDTRRPIAYSALAQIAHEMRWKVRAEAYDVDQAAQAAKKIEQQLREARERQRKLGIGLAGKGAQALQALNATLLAPGDILRFIKTGAEMELASLGEATQVVEVSGRYGGPVDVADVSKMSQEESKARAAWLVAEVARRNGLANPGEDAVDPDDEVV